MKKLKLKLKLKQLIYILLNKDVFLQPQKQASNPMVARVSRDCVLSIIIPKLFCNYFRLGTIIPLLLRLGN